MLRNVKEVWLRNLTEMDIVGEDDNGHRLDLHGRRCHLLKLRSNRSKTSKCRLLQTLLGALVRRTINQLNLTKSCREQSTHNQCRRERQGVKEIGRAHV